MTILNEALIRKRAEHNEGILPDLEEISLHQQEIEKLENLEQCCRYLKILLLQNNAIGKIENVSKLKDLEYLNLALNNISLIENLEGCESLKKLDFTVNFIDIEDFKESIYNLKANVLLEDLYLTGNGCSDLPFYRPYVVAHLPQLKQLDGKLITPVERIQAKQKLEKYELKLEELATKNQRKKQYDEEYGIKPGEGAHTKENRLEMTRELGAQKEEKEKNERKRMGTDDRPPKEIPSVYNNKGEVRQCNEGKFDFHLDDTSDNLNIIFHLHTPKFLTTELMDIDINPWYVRCIIKEKLTQLKLSSEIIPSTSNVQRSKTTGFLKITMVRLQPDRELRQKEVVAPTIEPLKPMDEKKSIIQRTNMNPANILGSNVPEFLRESSKKNKTNDLKENVQLYDDNNPDVPPLEPIR